MGTTEEKLLTAKELLEALRGWMPGGRFSKNALLPLLPTLPYATLPSGKRRYYLLSEVLDALKTRILVRVTPPDTASLHRRRPRTRKVTT